MLADFRSALRQLAKSPGFTAVALLTLALGIGANTAIFSVIHAVLLRPLPYPHAEQLVLFWEDEANFEKASIAWPDLLDWQRGNHSFTGIAGYRRDNYTLTGNGEPEMVRGARANASLFDVVGLPAQHGRVFTAAEDKLGAPALAVLSYGLWQRRYGGRKDVLGESITLNGEPYTIIGVMPASFATPTRTDFWTQIGRHADTTAWQDRSNHPGIYAIGRLKPGLSFTAGIADLRTISAQIARDYPDKSTGVVAASQPLFEYSVGSYRRGLALLLGAVAVVLLIACANLANLLLARSVTRETEFAVRSALGASRVRIVRQLLLESLLLALGGAVIGTLLAVWARDGIVALSPAGVARFQQVSIDATVLAVTSGLAIVTALVFGLWPAWRAARPNLRAALSSGGRGGSDAPAAARAREALIVAEVALTLVLLACAGLLLRSFARMQTADLGFASHGVLTARISLPEKRYATPESRDDFATRLLGRLRALPGVNAADLASSAPLDTSWQTSFHVDGRPQEPDGQHPLAEMNVISDGYFGTLGIPVLRGRSFGPQDNAIATTRSVIIDQEFAQRYWPGSDPVGRTLTLSGTNSIVIGVVPTLKVYGYGSEPKLVQAYLSMRQDRTRNYQVLVRAERDPTKLTSAVRMAVAEVDPNQPAWDIRTLDDRVNDTFTTARLYTFLITIFGGVALLLATVGLYGVLSYQVSRRTREFGIRVALGAASRQITGLVLRRGILLLAVGGVIGLAGAIAVGRLVSSLLYRTSPFDAVVFGTVALLLSLVTLVACWLPARRASRVDPLVALRVE